MVVPNRATVKDKAFEHDHNTGLPFGFRRPYAALYASLIARYKLRAFLQHGFLQADHIAGARLQPGVKLVLAR